ncbi:hypothetical protein NMY22_g19208 [Coprinellus aureogranulatus]|nr:hypothetical protein NMY22_g19208 [Coprinellus aureogranulatus]
MENGFSKTNGAGINDQAQPGATNEPTPSAHTSPVDVIHFRSKRLPLRFRLGSPPSCSCHTVTIPTFASPHHCECVHTSRLYLPPAWKSLQSLCTLQTVSARPLDREMEMGAFFRDGKDVQVPRTASSTASHVPDSRNEDLSLHEDAITTGTYDRLALPACHIFRANGSTSNVIVQKAIRQVPAFQIRERAFGLGKGSRFDIRTTPSSRSSSPNSFADRSHVKLIVASIDAGRAPNCSSLCFGAIWPLFIGKSPL